MIVMLEINDNLSIPEDELVFRALRASGPGGQNVNKVATAVQLRFDIAASSLPDDCRQRLLRMRDHRITPEGVAIIKAQRFRSQSRNRDDARQRLAALIRKGLHRPSPRRPTRPSRAARRRRLESKTHRGRIKALRKGPRDDG